MSVLHYRARPWVVFDAHDKQHREWFAEFQRKGSWGHCPVRFLIPDDAGDLITLIQRRLIQFYVDKEFVVKTPQKSRKKHG